MNVQETLNQNTAAMEKSTSVLNQVLAFFNLGKAKNEGDVAPVNASSELASGGNIYFTGTLAVGTEVFSDEEMATHVAAGDHDLADGNFITVDDAGLVTVLDKKPAAEPDNVSTPVDAARLAQLETENKQLQEALNKTNTTLAEQNDALEKIKNIKSKFVPENREQEIIDKKKPAENEVKLDLSKEAREARRAEREEIKNAKNKK